MNAELLTIQHWLGRHAKYRPNHLALVFEDKCFTYAELYSNVCRLANAFISAGVRKGDKVATLLPNSIELYETYWACAQIGAVAVPLSPLLRGSGLVNLLQNAGVSLVISVASLHGYLDEAKPFLADINPENWWLTDSAKHPGYKSCHEMKNAALALPPVAEELSGKDLYNIIYSSGTTGLPKGIVIDHGVRALYGSLFANAWRMTPESVVMHSGSIIFNGAFLTLMPAMYLGCTYVLESHFDPKHAIEQLRRQNVTHTILVPSQIINCLQDPLFNRDYLPSLEYVLSVGAPLHREHKELVDKKLPSVFYELYGLTEGFMTILDKTRLKDKLGSVGVPPAFMEIKIVDTNGNEMPQGEIGEIIGRSPLLMQSYYRQPELTADAIRNGWLYTGDLGYVDEEGFLYLTGRKKELIISGGVNVYPVDIEQVINHHEAVKEVAVFGVPHQEWGETPVAAIVLKPGRATDVIHPGLSSNDLRVWANERLEARYQKLHDVLLLKELPRNVAGKVVKPELLKLYEQKNGTIH